MSGYHFAIYDESSDLIFFVGKGYTPATIKYFEYLFTNPLMWLSQLVLKATSLVMNLSIEMNPLSIDAWFGGGKKTKDSKNKLAI